MDKNGTPRYHVLNMKATHKLWEIPYGQRIMCKYNPRWQPVGDGASKFRRMTGLFIKTDNYVRISDKWKDVPKRTKEDIWDGLMICLANYYCIYDSCVFNYFIK
jgi:hypothetical protein